VKNLLKSSHGSVKPYTRHSAECPHPADHDACSCPKWLYVFNVATGKKTRSSLNTPSWVEARQIASDTLRGMDPEIAAARVVTEKQELQQMTVSDACDLWIDRTRRQFGDGGSLPQYKSLMVKVEAWAESHGIVHVQDITPLQLEKWYSSRDWLRHADTTRQQRWGVLRSMFAFLKERGVIDSSPIASIKAIRPGKDHVQGPYIDEQVKKVLAAVETNVPDNINTEERDVYARRLGAFVNLLLHTGCDVGDAVLFDQGRIKSMVVDGREVAVYRYTRQKTKVLAVIPLTAAVADELLNVPTLKENPSGMPFRSKVDISSDVHTWSRRIQRALKFAGVEWVELPRDAKGHITRKKANAKQFRHTFAVRQLREGQRPEEVAKMLGHVDTTMVLRHYAPWVSDLDEAYVMRVVSGWKTK
jgi:integrase